MDAGRGKRGLVDALNMLELVAARSFYAGADFLLAGPLSRLLKNLKPGGDLGDFIILASPTSSGRLAEALSIRAVEEEWPREWRDAVPRGLYKRLVLEGFTLSILVDPVLRLDDGLVEYSVGELARRSPFVQVSKYIVRLAPLDFELALYEALEAYRSGSG
ncbi:MAG: hypothetical protein GSR78_00740 [Desulfurococcales archaeon]|nr:hypothetical protein [Desulfurococcales archaeon]